MSLQHNSLGWDFCSGLVIPYIVEYLTGRTSRGRPHMASSHMPNLTGRISHISPGQP
jgi:hypothetical protein